jgi:hypothetical protein
MEESRFARGCVSDDQLRRMAEGFNEEFARRRRQKQKEFDRFTKIALVHHHPFAYETAPSAGYDTFLRRLTGDEDTFTRFEEADRFLSWCAEREVSLILHGHKHEPHHVQAGISIEDKERTLVAIGCGSTMGAGGSPLRYNIVALNPSNCRWGVTFYEDASSSGAGFRTRELTIDTRTTKSPW